MGHARAVATADDPVELAKQVITRGLSVRQAEEWARREKQKPKEGGNRASTRGQLGQADPDLMALERQLSDILGLKVQVSHKGQGGSVALHYSSLDQLDMICQRLSGEPI
jgi:ParB family chromosome partitioning protein